MPSTRVVAPVVTGVVLVLLGLVAARVVAQEDTGPADYSPVTVPTVSSSPSATPTPTTTPRESPSPSSRPTTPPAGASQPGDDRYERVPQTPRAIDDDDDDDDDDGPDDDLDDDDDD